MHRIVAGGVHDQGGNRGSGSTDRVRQEGSDDGEKVKQLSSPSTSPIPQSGKPDSVWAWLFQLLLLIIPSDNAGISTVPDHTSEVLRPDERVEPRAAADENRSNWRSTAPALAKFLLRTLGDISPPVRSVILPILENRRVWPPSLIHYPTRLQVPQRRNREAIESLALRIGALAGSLCTPVPGGDIREESRRRVLGE